MNFELLPTTNAESCRELCNELMAFQKEKAVIGKSCFDSMSFETRMLKSYNQSLEKQIVLALHEKNPIGYVFSTIDIILENARTALPDWAPKVENSLGFYPDWVELPQKIACLNNLYLKDAYRGHRLGTKLFHETMAWIEKFEDVKLTFVFISNGNDEALKFYLDNGFVYSHEVFGGFIKAAYKCK
ncbi:MAG: GNAT family N-acetyltransferase [Bacteroidales bacterium]|nr:GNAT family N-acetyltransferase [Bacteroidales bacterium]